MTIAVVLGTRPEIIKMSPVIKELQRVRHSFFIIHTKQHYSDRLDKYFFDDLELPQPLYNLEVGSGSHGVQTGKALAKIEEVLIREKPDWVLIEGDTNSVLAGGLAAAKLHIKVGHVEAGLRSGDRLMPEELNRILTDHLSDLLFAPTQKAALNLKLENIPEDKIIISGNTIVDAVHQNLKIAGEKSAVLKEFGLQPKNYLLLTLHRAENVDYEDRFRGIVEGINTLAQEDGKAIIYPIHPRAEGQLTRYSIVFDENVRLVPPVSYLDFLLLQQNAACILTDSGGIQEEACVMRVPCVTIRTTTERPETIEVGANCLAGVEPKGILEGYHTMVSKPRDWMNPFGDGKAAEKIIIEVLKEKN